MEVRILAQVREEDRLWSVETMLYGKCSRLMDRTLCTEIHGGPMAGRYNYQTSWVQEVSQSVLAHTQRRGTDARLFR